VSFDLSNTDNVRLEGVHPDLVRVVRRCATLAPFRFIVAEGLRSYERQKQLFAQGKSQTMRSRHLRAANGYGHAVDLVPYIDLDKDGDLDLSWNWDDYHKLAAIVKNVAVMENVPIEWGGDWRTFKDGPHWQLPWDKYPGTK
jgi:peptidoglycan L-alanyl-D-glutamate endopeptidase CwlK